MEFYIFADVLSPMLSRFCVAFAFAFGFRFTLLYFALLSGAFGSSTNRNVITSTTKRHVLPHVLVTPPRPELTEPRRGIRSTPSRACRAKEQRAFGRY